MRKKEERKVTCGGCIWELDCKGHGRCEHFTPADDSLETEAYMEDLRMRAEEYKMMIEEYNDT